MEEENYVRVEDGFGYTIWIPMEGIIDFCRNLLRAKYGIKAKWKPYR